MKEKEVLIAMHSVHAYDSEDTDSLDFTTDGLYRYENGVGTLRYWESEVTGMPGTQTKVEISPDGVIVDRVGTVNSRMEFREGLKNVFPYETPYGLATMGMDTRRIRSRFNEHGGDVEAMADDLVRDLRAAIDELAQLSPDGVRDQRYRRFRGMGVTTR